MVKRAQYNYEQELVKKFKSSPKLFHKHVRGNQNVRSGVTKLIPNPGDSPTETDYEPADTLCTFFEAVFVTDGNEDLPDFPDRVTEEMSLREPTFTEEDVRKKLQKLKPDKSQGPDGIHPKILQECAAQLSYPWFTIVLRSLEEGRVPTDWKSAVVTPIHKKGKRTSPGNYRPVSLTSIPCKVLGVFVTRPDFSKY